MIKRDTKGNIIANIDLTKLNNSKIAKKRKKELKKELEPQKGYIYIAYNKYTNLYKIGSTKNPELRFKHLSLSNGVEIEKIFLSKETIYYIQIEMRTHKKFIDYKALGEWFKLNDNAKSAIEYIINRIENIKSEIDMYGQNW